MYVMEMSNILSLKLNLEMFNKRPLQLLILDPRHPYIVFGVDIILCLNLCCLAFLFC